MTLRRHGAINLT